MKLEFLSKSVDYKGGEPYKTRVVLGNSEGAIYPVFFSPDAIAEEAGVLYERAMDAVLMENFPDKGQSEKLNKIDKQLEENKKAVGDNQKEVADVKTLTDVLVFIAISAQGGMDRTAYSKVAALIAPLVQDKRYTNGDIVAMPYPFDTNPKWKQGTATIFRFTAREDDGYTYKGQKVEDMLQQGVLTIVLPRLN
ncbi:TPA: DUF1366 domain-containing protein [Streptococcus pyogenes]|nr:DUF1366 domain-containing protein [Streptococcus pyogenes]